VLHDGVAYDLIQSQGHTTFKVNFFSFPKLSSLLFTAYWQMNTSMHNCMYKLRRMYEYFVIEKLTDAV